MKLACSSYSYHDELDDGEMTLAEFVEICGEEHDIDGVELIDEHLPAEDPDTLAEVRATADEHGVDIACLSVFYNDFAKPDAEERRDDVEKVKAWLDRADRLDADVLRAFAGFPGLHDREFDDEQVWRDIACGIQECLDYARTVDVTLAVENHNHDGIIKTADDVFDLRRRVNGDLPLVLDLANYVDGVESVRRTSHLAAHVHAAYDRVADDGSDPNYPYYPDVLDEIDEEGYDGYVTLEYEGDGDDYEMVPRALSYLATQLD
ncbi:sugar phosphate isomerase/epimerase family protein [Halomicrococcus sp. SG-WS-1]|uniref:sugar phosphate isomerase/epimerase family protein n=1 Tax=Halomicrococcus sp. SG-WS-1 TaxID=3439057 RepID=UPI003F792F65